MFDITGSMDVLFPTLFLGCGSYYFPVFFSIRQCVIEIKLYMLIRHGGWIQRPRKSLHKKLLRPLHGYNCLMFDKFNSLYM